MENSKVFAMKLSKVYPLLVQKAKRKNRTKEEVDRKNKISATSTVFLHPWPSQTKQHPSSRKLALQATGL